MCGWTGCKETRNLLYCGHCDLEYCPKHFAMDTHTFSVKPTKDKPGWIKYDERKPGRLRDDERRNHEFNFLQRRKMLRTHSV